jgi:hypothetical protein
MATDFKNLSVDYKTLLRNTTISDRVGLTRTSSGQQLLSALTPTELANIFPDYYKRSNPDVSGFIEATARRYGRGKSQIPGTEYVENAKPGKKTGTSELGRQRVSGRTASEAGPSVKKDPIIQRLEETGLKLPPDVGAKDITERGSALLKLIQSKESMPREGYSTYDVTYGNYSGKSKYITPEQMFNGRKLSDLNIDEVLQYQKSLNAQTAADNVANGQGTSAVGRGQFISGTLKLALGYAGISPKDYGNIKFTPELQDKLMLLTAIHKRGLDPDKIEQWINDPKAIQGIGDEWEGLSFRKGFISEAQLKRELEKIAGLPANKKLYEDATSADAQKNIKLIEGLPQPLVEWYDKLPEYRKSAYANALNRHIEDNFNGDLNKFNQRFNTNPVQTASELQLGGEFRNRVVEGQRQVADVRKGAITSDLKDQLNYAAQQTGVNVEVVSGGQRMEGAHGHTGSHRHDQGKSADLKLFVTDQKGNKVYLSMNNPEDQVKMRAFMKHAVVAGATGVGAALDYMGDKTMHIGGGDPAVWGKQGGRPANWAVEAFNEGKSERSNRLQSGEDPIAMWKQQREMSIKQAQEEKKATSDIIPSNVEGQPGGALPEVRQEPKKYSYQVSVPKIPLINEPVVSTETIKGYLPKGSTIDKSGKLVTDKSPEEMKKYVQEKYPDFADKISDYIKPIEHADGGTIDSNATPVQNATGPEDVSMVNREGQVTDTVSSSEKLIPGPVQTRVQPERLITPSENLKEETNKEISAIRADLNRIQDTIQRTAATQPYSPIPMAPEIEHVIPTDQILNSSMGRYNERIHFAEQGRHFSHGAANYASNG